MKKIMLALAVFILFIPLSVFAVKGGKPGDNLQQQIDELILRVEALEQAPTGAIDVYDANNQYLGILVSPYETYYPPLKKSIRFDLGRGSITSQRLSFESDDCSGQPYVSSFTSYAIIENSGKYYTGEMSTPIFMDFYTQLLQGECLTFPSRPYPFNAVKAIEVTLPFTLPVALPLRFE